MRTAVFSYYIHNPQGIGAHHTSAYKDAWPEWARIGHKYAKQYAKVTNSDFIYTSEYFTEGLPAPHFEILRPIFDKQFDKYDKVLFLDADVVPYTTRDIFKVDVEGVGQWDEQRITQEDGRYEYGVDLICKKYGLTKDQFKYDDGSWINNNSGVVVWTREALDRARETWDHPADYYSIPFQRHMQKLDQDYIRVMCIKSGIPMTKLDWKWNVKHGREKPMDGGNFFHYTTAGGKVPMVEIWGDNE